MFNKMSSLCFVLLAWLSACQAPPAAEPPPAPQKLEVKYLLSEATAAANLPFSDAVRVGDLLFLSGTIGSDPQTGQLVEGGIGPETHQTLANIKSTLEANGSSMDRVFKCTVMLADIADWPAMNEVYVTFFPNNKPARSAFGTSGLAMGARLEIECIATMP